MASSSTATLRIWHPWCYGLLAVVSTPHASNGFSAADQSFLVVAVWDTTDHIDAYGIARYSVGQSSLKEGVTTALHDYVNLSWTLPLAGTLYPDHINIYHQAATTWNWANTGTLIKVVDGDQTSATLDNNASVGTALPVNQDSATNIDLTPCFITPPAELQLGVRGLNGIIRPQSYPHYPMLLPGALSTEARKYDMLPLGIQRISTAQANIKTLRKWTDKSWPVILINANDSTDIYYDYWHGTLNNLGTGADLIHEQNADIALGLKLMGQHVKS